MKRVHYIYTLAIERIMVTYCSMAYQPVDISKIGEGWTAPGMVAEPTSIANLNPCLAENERILLAYYKKVRERWSQSAINALKKRLGIKLNSNINRCQFAIEAAKQEAEFRQLSDKDETEVKEPPDSVDKASSGGNLSQVVEEGRRRIERLEAELQERQHKEEQNKAFFVLLLKNRLLAPGPPLNGTEESPAMRILGSPKTLTELEANYRELIKREHPDVSPFTEEEAINRFAYLRSLYRLARDNWSTLRPTAEITPLMLEKRMKAPVPFSPESFWTISG